MADVAPEIKVKLTAEDTGVAAAIRELGVQLNQLKRTQDDVGGSARKMGDAEAGAGRSMREAREGARLLSEETGVHLNRGLVSVISQSSTLGPLLNAAFPVAAAIGFGEVIATGTEKLTSLIASTFIYTEAMQREYTAQLTANKEIEKGAAKIEQLKKAYELIGLTGSARGSVLARQAKDDVDAAIKELDRLKAKKIEVEEPGFGKRLLGGVLDTIGVHTGIGIANAQPGIDAKNREIGVQQERKKVADSEELAAEKELDVQKAAEAKTAAEKAKALRDQINKATLAQIEAVFANELSLYKAQHAELDQENEADHVKGLESLAEYYTRKRQLAAESSQKEIDALTAERARVLAAPTKDKVEEIQNQTKAAALANQIAIAKVTATKTQEQLENEQARKQDELDKKVLEFQSQIAKAQGLRFDEASERIAAEAKQMEETLREAGLTPDQVDAMVGKFKAAATQQAQFASSKSAGQNAIAGLSDEEEDIRLKNSALVADAKIVDLERARIPVLQKIAADLKAAAVGPQQIQEANDFGKAVDRIAIAAKRSEAGMKTFSDQSGRAIQGDLNTFLTQTIVSARSIGDAFRQLAGSVVASIQQIVVQLLIQLAIQKLVKAASRGFSTGGLVSGGAGHAQGGLITGPGTGTSDSIPAMLSAGEFVVSASAVQDFGVHNLATINRGMRVPSINGLAVPRFAEGGLVQSPGGHGGDLRLGIGLDEGLILRHLSSKGAGKVILQHLANNPKAAGKALQRGE
jgi:hypothetical protein